MSDYGGEAFSVGGVLGRTFSVLLRNIVPFGVLAIVIQAPIYLYGIFVDPAAHLGEDPADLSVGFLALALAQVLLGYALMATLVYGTVADLRGYPASMGECISKGLGLLLPVFALAFITTIIVVLGFVLLVVPGIFLMIIYWVVIPVAVVERPGLFACYTRSMELTRGNRWRIFGLFLVLVVLMIGFTFVIGIVGVAAGLGALESGGGSGLGGAGLVYLLFDWVSNAILTAFWSVMVAVTYHDLRIAQEGADTEEIAAVFD